MQQDSCHSSGGASATRTSTAVALVLAAALVLWGCAPVPGPASPGISTSAPTAAATVVLASMEVPTPTASHTPAPTATPVATETPVPTSTATATHTPGPPTETPLPTDTPTPTNTPIPPVDWRLVSWRQLTPCENRGGHSLFITVLDAAGNGLPGVPVLIQWEGGSQVVYTGDKPERGPGCTDFPMYGGYTVQIAEGTTDVTPVLSSQERESQRCDDTNDNVANSYGHYSYEVIFQRTH